MPHSAQPDGEFLPTPPDAAGVDVRHRAVMVAHGGLWQVTTLGDGPPPPGPPIDDAVRVHLEGIVQGRVAGRIVEGLVIVETAGDADILRTWPVYAACFGDAGFRRKVVRHLELRR